MKMIKYHSVKDIPIDLYTKLYNLNFRSNGMMRDLLVRLRHNVVRSKSKLAHGIVYTLVDNFEVVSWIISDQNQIHAYTRHQYRGSGHASQLIEQFKKDFPYCRTSCHGNFYFWNKFGIRE